MPSPGQFPWQRYTDATAHERMARGQCPECGNLPKHHTGHGSGSCSLTDTGAAGRVWQYQQDTSAEAER